MNRNPTQFCRRLALGFCCIALVALTGCTNPKPEPKSAEKPTVNPDSKQEENHSAKNQASDDVHRYLNAVIVEKKGEALYEENCASCHDGGVHRGPNKSMVALMSANSIFKALTDGVMTSQAQALSDEEMQRVAEYFSNSRL